MKVVPYPKLFLSIFYLEFLEHGKAPFGSVKVWADLNPFEINLILETTSCRNAGKGCAHKTFPGPCASGSYVHRAALY
jgi:hypothetical protein